jgi:hypothetical protein
MIKLINILNLIKNDNEIIHLPDLTMNYEDLKKYLKKVYNIDLTK